MSFDIIQIIPSPKGDDLKTDFPAIAFRSTRQEPVAEPVDAALEESAGSANRAA